MRSIVFNFFKGITLSLLAIVAGFTANAQYCTPTYSSSQCINYNMYIQNFSTTGGVTNITNNGSGCGNTSTSYIYYNNAGHVATPVSTVNFSVTIGASYPQGVKIWIDYNQDGDFTDAGENVWTSSGTISAGNTATGSFSIPASASIGMTRMRVRSSYATTSINPCGAANYGEAEDYNFSIVGNCNAPAAVNVSFVNSMAVEFNWSAVTGTYGYDYAVTTSQNGPSTGTSTNNTTAMVTGLTPNTQYYVHVRNNCASYPSQWTTSAAFTTLPPCSDPTGFSVTRVDSNSADFTWGAIGTAVEYQYFVNLDRATPTSSVGANVATTNFGSATALSQGTVYYVHLRVMCTGNDSSGWSLDSMYIPNACRTSHVLFNDLTTDRAVAYWDPANTAYEYEYVLNKSDVAPQYGAKMAAMSKLMSFLDDKEKYYFHLRSHCDDKGIITQSQWATFSFETIGLDIYDVDRNNKDILLYPNPVKDQMEVMIGGTPSANGKIRVLDMTGKVLKVQNFNTNEATLDVSDLSVGMYMVQYIDENHREQVTFNKL
mgnify:CR=1 FL=1